MKRTKKQLAAMLRIVSREQYRNDGVAFDKSKYTDRVCMPKPAGLHPSGTRYAVTDGALTIMTTDEPEGIPLVSRFDECNEFVESFVKDGRSYLMNNPPSVEDCKNAIRDWKKNPTTKFPKIYVSAETEIGTVSSCFNARLLLDALEAMGTYTHVYIGMDKTNRWRYPCLTIYRRDGRDERCSVSDWNNLAFLLPCAP